MSSLLVVLLAAFFIHISAYDLFSDEAYDEYLQFRKGKQQQTETTTTAYDLSSDKEYKEYSRWSQYKRWGLRQETTTSPAFWRSPATEVNIRLKNFYSKAKNFTTAAKNRTKHICEGLRRFYIKLWGAICKPTTKRPIIMTTTLRLMSQSDYQYLKDNQFGNWTTSTSTTSSTASSTTMPTTESNQG